MKKVYEYGSLVDLNKALMKFDREGLDVCVKIVGEEPKFFCITEDEEKEDEEESPEEGDTAEEGEAEKKE